ncbi:unnamed protein product [Rotaria magnacalcarata]|uniref:Uncharacterized protein n=1 Tax=Rotaria magnacalcarata TaxID=392030 RepID=A0A8S2NN91_9BILA|nr:unnamed protein product [Rotaria magnacalcarata]
MDRTIASARSFLAGLFSSEESDNKIQATGPFEIEVHHFPYEDMIFDMRWPRYGAYIVLKYFISKTDKSETYVTVHFDGEPQVLPDCEDHYCSYSTFLKSLQNRIDKPKKIYQA